MRVKILIFTVIFFALLAGCTHTTSDPVVTTIHNVAKFGNGSHDLVYKKIPIISLKGTHAEMGAQHGGLLSIQIKNYYEKVVLPYMNERFGREFFLVAAQKYLMPHIPKEYIDEMKEIAKTSNMDFDNILLINTFVDIASVLAGRNNELVPFSGVSFGFVNELSKCEGPIIARNMDLRFGIDAANMQSYIFVIHPVKGKPYMYVSWPGMVGTMTGMNLSGFVATSNPVTGPKGLTPGIPYTILMRNILENCDTVPKAHEVIISSKLIGGNSFFLSDISDKIWTIESTPFKISVRREHKVVTEEGELPTYTLSSLDTFVASALNDECIISSEHQNRVKILSSRLGNLGYPWSAQDMSNFAGKLSINGRTVLSVVLIPSTQNIRIWRIEDNDREFYEIDKNASYGILGKFQ